MVVRNQHFGTFSPFCLEINSPLIQWTKCLLCILLTPQRVHIYPLVWIIWLHFMLLYFFEVMVVRNQHFGTFRSFCLETNSPFMKWAKYLLCILFTPQWVHIYPLEWIIWLHFMTLHCFDEMVVRNQHFGTFSPFHLEINSLRIQWTKYLLSILFAPQWVHIYPLEWIIWLHFMLLHFF